MLDAQLVDVVVGNMCDNYVFSFHSSFTNRHIGRVRGSFVSDAS